MATLAERAATIAAKARSYADAKGSTKPAEAANDEPKNEGSGSPPRHKWRLYSPNGTGTWPITIDVWLPDPMTQPEVRAAFACDAIPLEHATL